MTRIYTQLDECIYEKSPLRLALELELYLQRHQPLLTHRGSNTDCFHLVSDWLSHNTVSFDPAFFFKELLPWGRHQFMALCGTYYFYKQSYDKAKLFFAASLRILSSYQPSHYYIFLIDARLPRLSLRWRCQKPFTTLDIQLRNAAVCCTSWLPYSVGNPSKETASEIWGGHRIMAIRQSINDGNYKYCNPSYCPHLRQAVQAAISSPTRVLKESERPKYLQLSYDRSCNLSCPTCRKNIIQATSSELEEFKHIQEYIVEPLLKYSDSVVSVTYSGDAFASTHYRRLLSILSNSEYSNVGIVLATNGLLLSSSKWLQYQALWSRVKVISISVDAATKSTYARLRPPGDWDRLINNLQNLSLWKKKNKASTSLVLNFCVQLDNYREMQDFLGLAIELGFDQVYYQRLLNWGLFSSKEYLYKDVANPLNPEYNSFKSALSRIKKQSESLVLPYIRFGVLE